MALTTMSEIIDFLEPCKKGVWPHLLMDDSSRPEAGVVSPALAGGSELLCQNLCAELTTLNHYGLGGAGCALAEGLFERGSIKARGARHRRFARTLAFTQDDRQMSPKTPKAPGPLCSPTAYSMQSEPSNRVKLQRQFRVAQFLFNQIALRSRLLWRVSRRKDDQKVR
jgi:hypothetical protein